MRTTPGQVLKRSVLALALSVPALFPLAAGTRLAAVTVWPQGGFASALTPRPLAVGEAELLAGRLAGAPAAGAVAPLGVAAYLRDVPYGEAIARAADRAGVDPLLVAAVVEAESNFRPDAVSPKGALGLMQLMPAHVLAGIEPLDPEVNLELGAALLAGLEARYAGQLHLALAAYHAGPGAVDRHGGLPPYTSTERYVRRVLEIYLEHYTAIVDRV